MSEIAAVPEGACDCHMHFYAPQDRTSPGATGGFSLPPADVATYRAMLHRLGLTRFVAVQSIAYGFDNRVMEEAVAEFGDAGRMVVVVPPDSDPGFVRDFDRKGGRGVRAYMLAGAPYRWDELDGLGRLVAPFGWHLQVQLDGRTLPDVEDLLRGLPCEVVIDHNGKFLEPVDTDSPAFASLLRLLDTGRAWVKLSAPYETSKSGPPHYEDVSRLARALVAHAPDRLVWATNFPHPGRSVPPDEKALLDLLSDWAPDRAVRDRILKQNPERLYGF